MVLPAMLASFRSMEMERTKACSKGCNTFGTGIVRLENPSGIVLGIVVLDIENLTFSDRKDASKPLNQSSRVSQQLVTEKRSTICSEVTEQSRIRISQRGTDHLAARYN